MSTETVRKTIHCGGCGASVGITDTKCPYCNSHLEPPAGFHHLVVLNGNILMPGEDYSIQKGNPVLTFKLRERDTFAIYSPLGAQFYRVCRNVKAGEDPWESDALQEVDP
jgi:hypothetical protein